MITPIIETERLILRPLTVQDAPDIFERWCTDERVAKYVTWSVHGSVKETEQWLAMEEAGLESDESYQWGFTLKESGYLFGSGGFFYNEEEEAWELGYNLMFKFWNQGYATEAAKAMLDFGINVLQEKEFMARHAVDNPASGAVMRKCGFQYEKNEMHTKFDGVTSYDTKKHRLIVLKDNEIELTLERKTEGNPEKGWVPAYHFAICKPDGTKMGVCDLRIGHNEMLYYGGNIGYRIEEEYRGHHYAGKACLLLFELAKKHNLEYLIITCNPDNYPSRKTCEYAGGKLIEIAEVPEGNDMRERGETEKCIYNFVL